MFENIYVIVLFRAFVGHCPCDLHRPERLRRADGKRLFSDAVGYELRTRREIEQDSSEDERFDRAPAGAPEFIRSLRQLSAQYIAGVKTERQIPREYVFDP